MYGGVSVGLVQVVVHGQFDPLYSYYSIHFWVSFCQSWFLFCITVTTGCLEQVDGY